MGGGGGGEFTILFWKVYTCTYYPASKARLHFRCVSWRAKSSLCR